jgi:hypothetical protein
MARSNTSATPTRISTAPIVLSGAGTKVIYHKPRTSYTVERARSHQCSGTEDKEPIGTFLHYEMGISWGGIAPLCDGSSIRLENIFCFRSLAHAPALIDVAVRAHLRYLESRSVLALTRRGGLHTGLDRHLFLIGAIP